MRSAQEAGAYLRALKQILEFTDVSDVNMEEGSLRVDANVSARLRGETKLGTKTEVKNMNSFSGVGRALEAEFARQVSVLERGARVEQQTMLWDGARGVVRRRVPKRLATTTGTFPSPTSPRSCCPRDGSTSSAARFPSFPRRGAHDSPWSTRSALASGGPDVICDAGRLLRANGACDKDPKTAATG